MDTEQFAVVDGFVDKLAARTRAKMDGNFAEGSTEAGVAAGMKEFFSNNPLLTPEVQAKYNLVCTFVKHKAEILKGDITGAVNYIGKLMA